MRTYMWYRSFDYIEVTRGIERDPPNYYDYTYRTIPARRVNMLKSVSPQTPPSNEPQVIRLTADQEAVLQEQFNKWPKALHTADVVLLAAETGLSEADVQAWYNNRLAQWRKEQGLGFSLGLH